MLTSSRRPIQYRITAPSSEPAVEAISTPGIVSLEVVVINPPNGRMTSEGMGGKIFSSASIRKIPAYPNCSMISVIHVFIRVPPSR
ncbi:hypothetical protein D3C86_1972970 [compost metagenome]